MLGMLSRPRFHSVLRREKIDMRQLSDEICCGCPLLLCCPPLLSTSPPTSHDSPPIHRTSIAHSQRSTLHLASPAHEEGHNCKAVASPCIHLTRSSFLHSPILLSRCQQPAVQVQCCRPPLSRSSRHGPCSLHSSPPLSHSFFLAQSTPCRELVGGLPSPTFTTPPSTPLPLTPSALPPPSVTAPFTLSPLSSR